MHDQNRLIGPLALFQEGDEEALFFEQLSAILEDRDQILYGERYVGYDARGTRFHIVRTIHKRPILFGLLSAKDARLELAGIDDVSFKDEARARITTGLQAVAREWFGEADMSDWPDHARQTYSDEALAAASLDELLQLGIQWAHGEPPR